MTAKRTARRGDDGSATLFLAVSMLGLLVLAGLVVDGGSKIRAVQRADALAAEAARAGGQAIALPAAIAGRAPTADPAAAVAAARSYLDANAVSGTITVTGGGRQLDVRVTSTSPTVFLGLIGISTLDVHGHATATLVRGVTGVIP